MLNFRIDYLLLLKKWNMFFSSFKDYENHIKTFEYFSKIIIFTILEIFSEILLILFHGPCFTGSPGSFFAAALSITVRPSP
jgi:hypothetical protein